MQKFLSKYELNIVKNLNFYKIINIIKIFTSFYISKIFREPIIWGLPYSFSVEPTNHCNLKCPECPSGLGKLTRQLGIIKVEDFERYISKISKSAFYIQLFFQGEPFVNKNLNNLIQIAHKHNMYVAISTNGILLKNRINEILDNPPDKIIFSIDGLDEVTYQNYRVGGKFSDALAGLVALTDMKRLKKMELPFIEFQFIVMKQNEHQMNDVIKLGKELGVNKVTFKTMQVYSKESAEYFLPKNPKYLRYEFDKDSLKIKGKFRNECFALWRTSVITWDGQVVPCCFDKDASVSLGNLNNSEFRDIWFGHKYKKFRKALLNNRNNIDMCKNCTEGVKINLS